MPSGHIHLLFATTSLYLDSLENMDKLGLFFMFCFIICVVLAMLNILIAQLWSSYEGVADNKVLSIFVSGEFPFSSSPDGSIV
jgi:hypothetical protein